MGRSHGGDALRLPTASPVLASGPVTLRAGPMMKLKSDP
jgi:hypothetical protein